MKRRIRIISITLVLTLLLSFTMVYIGNAVQTTYPTTQENTYQNTGDQQNDIIGVAKTQIGYQEGSGITDNGSSYENATKYGVWFSNYTNGNYTYTAWCGMFIAWCANQAGISKSVVPYCAGADSLSSALSSGNMHYYNSGYTPKTGDIAFISSSSQTARNFDHVGLVESVSADGQYVTTIEGNLTNKVQRITRPISGFYWGQTIAAFGSPNYQNSEPETTTAKISVSTVKLSQSELTLNIDDTKTLAATVLPENAADKSVTFSSSNNTIASVSKSGVVTAQKAGNAIVTVKTVDGGYTAQVKITVLAAVEETTIPVTTTKVSDDTKGETTTTVIEETTAETTTKTNTVPGEKIIENIKSFSDQFSKVIKAFFGEPSNSVFGLILVYISKSLSMIK